MISSCLTVVQVWSPISNTSLKQMTSTSFTRKLNDEIILKLDTNSNLKSKFSIHSDHLVLRLDKKQLDLN